MTNDDSSRSRYKIVYLPIAVKDLEEIVDYNLRENNERIIEIVDQIEERISDLSLFPEMGRIPDNNRLKNLGYRLLLVDKYIVFYVFQNEIVQIRRIIHGKRKYDFLL